MTTTDSRMTIRLSDEEGAVITGRAVAARLRERIEDGLRSSDEVIVDFEGVLTISPSAGDEIFAKLRARDDGGRHVHFVNMPEAVESLARYVIANRGSSSPAQ